MFLRDVEEDQELRSTLQLYKAKNTKKSRPQGDRMEVEGAGAGADEPEEMDEDSEDDGVPKISMDELLEDFDELSVGDDE